MKDRGLAKTSTWQGLAYVLFLVAGLSEVWLQWNRNFDLATYWQYGDLMVLIVPTLALPACWLALRGEDPALKLLAAGFAVVVALQIGGWYHDMTGGGGGGVAKNGLYDRINGFDTAWGVMCVVTWPLGKLGLHRQINPWAVNGSAFAVLVAIFVTLAIGWRPERQAFIWNPPAPPRYQEVQLMEAVRKGELARVNGLLDAGASIDSEAWGGWTALMHAVEDGQSGMVQALLARGADPEAREFVYGKRCSYGPSPDTCEPVPTNGSTALMIAAVNGHVDIAKMLLDAGADPRKVNKDGKRALELAQEAGQPGVVALLRETRAPGEPRQRPGE